MNDSSACCLCWFRIGRRFGGTLGCCPPCLIYGCSPNLALIYLAGDLLQRNGAGICSSRHWPSVLRVMLIYLLGKKPQPSNSCRTFPIHQDLFPQSNKLRLLLHSTGLLDLFANKQRKCLEMVYLMRSRRQKNPF